MSTPIRPLVLIVMGPMGCGKTTVGRLLAERLAWPFIDADDFHPAANVAKMRNGVALNDEDRRPWLVALRAEIDGWRTRGRPGILAWQLGDRSLDTFWPLWLLLRGWQCFLYITDG